MGIFSRIRGAFHNLGVRLHVIKERSDVGPEAKKEIAKLEAQVKRDETIVKPQKDVLVHERYAPKPPEEIRPKRYNVTLQLRGVSSTRKYPNYNETVTADSPEEAIAIAEEHWTERFGDEIDYVVSEEASEVQE